MITKYFQHEDGSLIPKSFESESEVTIPDGVKCITKEEFDSLLPKYTRFSAFAPASEYAAKLGEYKKKLQFKFFSGETLTPLQAKVLSNMSLSASEQETVDAEMQNLK